jgi:hypothetical protein
MNLSDKQIKDYETYARNPENWIFAGRRNLAIAHLLSSKLREVSASETDNFYERSGCFYTSYFLAGVAIENALKAVMISRDPNIVANGKLEVKKFGSRTGHALLTPVNEIIGNLSEVEIKYLKKLEEFTWAGRYSVPTQPDSLYDEEKKSLARLSHPGEDEILNDLFERLVNAVENKK